MMAYYYKKQEEMKVIIFFCFTLFILNLRKYKIIIQKLAEQEDDSYLNSEWADGNNLRRQFQGLNNIKWKPI